MAWSQKNQNKRSGGKRLLARNRGMRIQSLEDRCVLSISAPAFLEGESTLAIAGGDLDDTVVVSENDLGEIVIQQYESSDRLTTVIPRSEIDSLLFLGGGGDDRFTNKTSLAVRAEGGAGNDTLISRAGDDTLIGGLGNDRLEGGAGNDTLDGGPGVDNLFGEEGEDRLEGGEGSDTLYGGEGDDRLNGQADGDTLNGGSGDDYLNGGTGDDTLNGNSGNDFLNGESGDDRLNGGDGADTLLGEAGVDILHGDAGVDRIRGGSEKDTLYGDEGDDFLYGDSGNDLLIGSSGDDYLNGGEGNDTLRAGSGEDFLNGAGGNDRLEGDGGNDTLLGEAGDDILHGDAGVDRLKGGADNDTLYGGDGNDFLYGESGEDLIIGGLDNDYLNGGSGDDTLRAGSGEDFLNGASGDDRLEGDGGNDTLLGEAGRDVLHGDEGVDRLKGGADDDTLYGGDGNDLLYGDAGADLIFGDLDNDYLSGGVGDDYLRAGLGDDLLNGGSGGDRLEGDAGDDTLLGGDGVDVLHGDAGDDQLFGGGDNDTLYGGLGNDIASGQEGDDLIVGDDGNDVLRGGAGEDLLRGRNGDDHLEGNEGDDRLEGESGADVLLGGDGVDQLIGGQDRDLLIGGGDADTLHGSEHSDILIGASTAYDSETDDLRQALTTWNSGLDYTTRVAALTAHHANVRFVPHETVFADLASDTLFGEGDLDWHVLSAVNEFYNPLGAEKAPHTGHGSHSGHHSPVILSDAPPALEGFALVDSMDVVREAQPGEAVHSMMPHADEPSKQGEHLALFQLVRYSDVTHTAIGSGDWSDPAVWEGGQVPSAGARVLIPYGATVTVDAVTPQELTTVRVDGLLRFATDTNTELRVDTLVVTNAGTLEMGSEHAPIESGVTARLLFTDTGPIDTSSDPFLLGRGLVTHGGVRMHGEAVTPHLAIAGPLRAGDTAVQLSSAPTGWKVGDILVLPGTAIGGSEDELRPIRAVDGATITVDPLAFDHTPLEAGLEIRAANLTRNVVLSSETPDNSRRGHVMFMHNRDIHVANAMFVGLGRTDKNTVLTDPQVDDQWNPIEGTGDNPRGRYAVHFHRNGVLADTPPSTVRGSSVLGGPGWGYVNHSSYVEIDNNVAYGVNGAAFVAEAGDEIGTFDGNYALHTTGSTDPVDSRVGSQDFGFTGDGFWLQGPGVSVTNNYVAGSAGSAYFYYTRGLRSGGGTTEFLAENLDDPAIAAGETTLPVISTPVKQFSGNVGHSSTTGLSIRYHLRDAQHGTTSVLSDSVLWNNKTGIDLPYAHNTELRDIDVLVDPSLNAFLGVDNNSETKDITYTDLRVEGYERALLLPIKGTNVVDGGAFQSKSANLVVRPAAESGLSVLVTGSPQFASVGTASAYDVTMQFLTENASLNPNQVFYAMQVRLQYGEYQNHRLYFKQQESTDVPFPQPVEGLPAQYVGLTQEELLQQFGVAIGGEIAPGDALNATEFYGLVWPVG